MSPHDARAAAAGSAPPPRRRREATSGAGGVEPARAALVQAAFSREVSETPGQPGAEQVIVTALADAGGAAAFAARLGPLALAGLAPLTVTVFNACFRHAPGDVVRLGAGGPGWIVTGIADDPDTDSAVLTLRGPEPPAP